MKLDVYSTALLVYIEADLNLKRRREYYGVVDFVYIFV